ncbi:MAG: thioredoxin family protein [Candidatus Hydrothermarchaeales archaeon]
MSEILLEIFTKPGCQKCATAKKAIEEALQLMNEALMIERDISQKEDYKRALELGVREVPTLVINEKYQIIGIPQTSDELVRFINHDIKENNHKG